MWSRVNALILRNLYLYRRSLARIMEILFWPVMNLLVWGFVTSYLERIAIPGSILFLLGGVILWDILYRSQQAITLSITEEVWVKNILNVFVAPVRTFELMLATCSVGILKAAVTTVFLGFLAYLFYAFDLLEIGPPLIPFLAALLLFGWAVGMFTMALVLRYGHAAEALIWGVPFLIQPISAVFYPVDVLPKWLQAIAYMLPSTYVFEGMRTALREGTVALSMLVTAYALNVIYLGGAAAFFGWMLSRVREKGYLSRLNME
jgi:ABC-2 type transport system permease protein